MPEVTVRLPRALREDADGTDAIQVDAATAEEALRKLGERWPRVARKLFRVDGSLRPSVAVLVDNVAVADPRAASLRAPSEVSVTLALSGGSGGPPGKGGTAVTADLPRSELLRYSRQLLLPEVGLTGQKLLRASRVLLVGAGGLGSPAALYLAAAGVGTLGLVEPDRVDLTNLHRQVLYTTAEVGAPKGERAAERLRALNPTIEVRVHPELLTSANALEILRGYDVVVDGSDNFPTRYLVNDACVLLRKPDVFGSVYRFEGQVTVFDAVHGPCYRCLYPEPPPPDAVPTCAEGGVLGVLPGVVGLLEATEAIKLVLNLGEPLVGRLLLFDALDMRFREVRVEKSVDCPVCGPRPTQTTLIDYEAFCGVPGRSESVDSTVPSVTPPELSAELRSEHPPLLVDVRQPGEYAIVHLEGALLVPQDRLVERLGDITAAREVVVYCKSGVRSARAVRLLTELGVRNVRHLAGGLDAWTESVDPSLPRY